MNYRNIIITASTLVLLSCSTKTLTVTPLESTKYTGKGLVYSLPRNVLHIRVDVTRTTHIPGPYAAYAKKFLGIGNAMQEKSDRYSIANIAITSTAESDPSALFHAYSKKNTSGYLELTTSGLILPIDRFSLTAQTTKKLDAPAQPEDMFTDLSTAAFIGEEKSVYYSKQAKDSSFVRVPIQKTMIVERNMEEKAKEAADFIFLLRKKRTEFFNSDTDRPLEGAAIRAIFDEIDRLEASYLSLFVGKTITESIINHFDYTPTNPEGESTILFRYSPTKGIVGSTDFSGNPVLLEIKPEATPEAQQSIATATEAIKPKKKHLYIYYRIPAVANITITDGKNDLVRQRQSLYQYGTRCMVPLSQLGK